MRQLWPRGNGMLARTLTRAGLGLLILGLLQACAWTGGSSSGQSASQRAAAGDGPPRRATVDPLSVPDAIPRPEPRSRYGNPASYEQFGKRYYVMDSALGYTARGEASWYGSKFHGRRTSSGELYDMYKMTAAHPTLPIPSYVRVRHLGNGRQIVVRVNDRGPFHNNRIIDLSWVAAVKLGMTQTGTAAVEVIALDPNDPIYATGAEPPLSPAAPVTRAATAGGTSTVPSLSPEYREALRPQVYTPAQVDAALSTSAPAPAVIRPTQSPSAPSRAQFEPQGPDPSIQRSINSNASLYERLQTAPGLESPPVATSVSGVAPGRYVQFGAYSSASNAAAQRRRVEQLGLGPVTVLESGHLFRVVSGPFDPDTLQRQRARAASAQVQTAVHLVR